MSSLVRDEATPRDERLAQLRRWIERLFGAADFTIAPASADASFRRYFRIARGEHTWIAMDAPPEKEAMAPYIRIAAMLESVGVNAPRVLERNEDEGFLLNSDLGFRTYLAELEAGGDPDDLYRDALSALVRIQAHGQTHARELPPYGETLLLREMDLFREWFCGRHLGLEPSATERAELTSVFAQLTAEALDQPRVFVHRDYHSRNLMFGDGSRYGENPGILDFQDAVNGPVTYDLVSLLRDCYVAWPIERVRTWALHFRAEATAQGVECGSSNEQFLRWFDLMGVQRHLKAIGIFARLWHRDGKPGYLYDVPRTLNYVKTVCANYDSLKPLQKLIDERITPAMERTPLPT